MQDRLSSVFNGAMRPQPSFADQALFAQPPGGRARSGAILTEDRVM